MIPVNILLFIIAILTISLGFAAYKYYDIKNKSEKTISSSTVTSANISSTTTTSAITTPVFYELADFQGKSYVSTPSDFGTLLDASSINSKIGITDPDKPNFASVFIPENFTIELKDSNGSLVVGFTRPDVLNDNYIDYTFSKNLTNFNGGNPLVIWPAIKNAKLVIYKRQTTGY